MKLASWIRTPFAQPKAEETRMHQAADFPVIMTLPQGTPAPSNAPVTIMVRTGGTGSALVEMDAREVAEFEAQGLSLDIVAPEAVGHGDEAMIFRSALLRSCGDGCELREVLDQMIMVHPEVAAKIISAGSLGRVHFDQAVAALRVYMIHRVAQAPVVVL